MELLESATSWLQVPRFIDVESLFRAVSVAGGERKVLIGLECMEDGSFKVAYNSGKPVEEAASKLQRALEKQEEKTVDMKEEAALSARKILTMTEASMVAVTKSALKAVNATMLHMQSRIRPCCLSPRCRCEKIIRMRCGTDTANVKQEHYGYNMRSSGRRNYGAGSPERSRSCSPVEAWGRKRWVTRRTRSPRRSGSEPRASPRPRGADRSPGRAAEREAVEAGQEAVPVLVTSVMADSGANVSVVGRSMVLGLKQGINSREMAAMQVLDSVAANGVIEPSQNAVRESGESESGSEEAVESELENGKPEITIDSQSSVMAKFRAMWTNSLTTDRRGRVMPTVPVQEYSNIVRIWCSEFNMCDTEMEDMQKQIRVVASKILKKKRQEMKARINDALRHANVTVVADQDEETVGDEEKAGSNNQGDGDNDQLPDLV